MKLLLLAIFALSIFAVNEAFAEPNEYRPVIQSLIANSDGTHTLTWSAPTTDEFSVNYYDVRYAYEFAPSWVEAIATTETFYIISNLDTTEKYQFVIYARTTIGTASSPAYYTIPAEPTPEPITTPTIETKKKNKHSDSNDQPPWLGIDKDGKPRVKHGVIINGSPIDAANFHTTTIIPDTTLGKLNHIILTYFDVKGPSNIKLFQLCSVDEIGTPLGNSQWCIEVNINDFRNNVTNPTIQKINVIDIDNVITFELAEVFLRECLDTSLTQACLTTHISYSYNEIPESFVLASSAINYQQATWNNYFNDGLGVIDPNPEPKVIIIPYEPECKDLPLDEIMVPTRNNCNFKDLKLFEAARALESLN